MAKKKKRLYKVGQRVRMLVNDNWRIGTIIYITDTFGIGVKFDDSSTGECVDIVRLEYADGSLPDTIAEVDRSNEIEDLGSM